MVRDICRLIAVKSVRSEPEKDMPFGPGARAALDKAVEIAAEKGFGAVNFDNYAVHFDLNGNEPVLGMLAHLDVVAEGDGWTLPPYEGTVKDGRIYGRGAADDKGPAVAALYAMCAAREIAPELTKGARLILGTAEETGSEDIAYYRQKTKLPPFVFSPDADYPVINIEKGRFAPLFEASWRESGELPRCVSIEGGHTANIVPQYASAVIEGMNASQLAPVCAEYSAKTGAEITAHDNNGSVLLKAAGKSAHAAKPQEGVNALTSLLGLLSALPLARSESRNAIASLAELFPAGDTSGSALGIEQSDKTGELTLNFSILDFGKCGFKARFDCRYPLCAEKTVEADTEAALSKHGMRITERGISAVHCTDENSPFVRTLLRVYEDYTGRKGECIAIGGGTYVHDIEGGVAFGCAMPGTDNRMHGADEFAVIEELVVSAKMFTQVILDMCR